MVTRLHSMPRDKFILPSDQRPVQAIANGLMALGVGGILLYLGHIYLSRRAQ